MSMLTRTCSKALQRYRSDLKFGKHPLLETGKNLHFSGSPPIVAAHDIHEIANGASEDRKNTSLKRPKIQFFHNWSGYFSFWDQVLSCLPDALQIKYKHFTIYTIHSISNCI